jgi:hypothetical protein
MWFGLFIVFIELLQLVTTGKECGLTVLHTSKITIDTLDLLSLLVFTNRCLVAAFNSGLSPSSVFPYYRCASAISFSQQQLTTTEFQRLSH